MTAEKPPGSDSHGRSGGGESRLEELLAGYIDRLNRREMLDREEIRSQHPEEAAELLERLSVFEAFAGSKDAELGTLGDYKLLREIGRGGMGVVYEAWESSMNRRVALKVLPGGFAADSKAVSRFVREAQVAGKLMHPNVVLVYGMGVEESTPYYAMELVEGQTLAEVLGRWDPHSKGSSEEERNKLLTTLSGLLGSGRESRGSGAAGGDSSRNESPDTDSSHDGYFQKVAASFAAVADGLEHAHRRGIIHRDIKPSNLILDQHGHLRILDFGLARIEGEQSLTVTGDFLGTVLYVSPEQAMARRVRVDHRTDIYSLGATLYQMLTWQPPFQGKSHQDTLSQIIFEDPPGPRRTHPHIPKDLETIVLHCLMKDPRERYGTAEALAQDLRRFVRGAPIEARPQPLWRKATRTIWRHKLRLSVSAIFLALATTVALLFFGQGGVRDRLVWTAPVVAVADAVSPDGRFLSAHDPNRQLRVRELATGEERYFRENDRWPNGSIFSPDGTQIACAWLGVDGSFELRIAAITGTESRVIYSGRGKCRPCSWSPNGEQILVLLAEDSRGCKMALVSTADGSVHVLKSGLPGSPVLPWRWRFYRPWTGLFSPDGRVIAYEWQGDITLLPTDGSPESAMGLVSDRSGDRLLGWSPDGRSILSLSNRRGSYDLWLIDVAGGTRRLLVPGVGAIRRLGCTSDGRLYYCCDSTGERQPAVYTASVDPSSGKVVVPGTRIHQGKQAELRETEPRWAPDGSYLAYLSEERAIVMHDLATGKIREITPELEWLGSLCPSPDGRRFLCEGVPDYQDWERYAIGYAIYSIETRSGAVSVMEGWTRKPLQWFPDGTSILYLIVRQDVNYIMQRELDSGDEKELLAVPSLGVRKPTNPALSPDGRLVVFATFEREPALYVLKVSTLASGETQAIRRGPMREWPKSLAWTPDGSHVLVGGPPSYLLPAQGGEIRVLDLKDRGTCKSLRMHPDGRRVAFESYQQTPTYEIRVLENFLHSSSPENSTPTSLRGPR